MALAACCGARWLAAYWLLLHLSGHLTLGWLVPVDLSVSACRLVGRVDGRETAWIPPSR